jgi:hypothetical protein
MKSLTNDKVLGNTPSAFAVKASATPKIIELENN